MRVLLMIKLVMAVGALCSLSAFAAGIFSQPLSGDGDGQRYVTYYAGKGAKFYEDTRNETLNYKVTLKIAELDDGRLLFEYNFNGSTNTYQRFIVEQESDAWQKVFVPASADAQHDYSSYVETGWASEVEYDRLQEEEGTPKKHTILLNYLDTDGNRVTLHVLAYKKEGKWKLITVSSVGNADGIIYLSGHELEQVIERLPE